jgi:hypothetical protein
MLFPVPGKRYKSQLPAYLHIRPSGPEEHQLRQAGYIEANSIFEPNAIPAFTPRAWALRHEMDYAGTSSPAERPLRQERQVSIAPDYRNRPQGPEPHQPRIRGLEEENRKLNARISDLNARLRQEDDYRLQVEEYFLDKGLTDHPRFNSRAKRTADDVPGDGDGPSRRRG